MPNCKVPAKDSVQRFWLKRLKTLHGKIAEQMNKILNDEERNPRTGVIAEAMYKHLEERDILKEGQKGCGRGSRVTKNLSVKYEVLIKNTCCKHTMIFQ